MGRAGNLKRGGIVLIEKRVKPPSMRPLRGRRQIVRTPETTPPSFDDYLAETRLAQAAADDGIARSSSNADEVWVANALAAVHTLAKQRGEFTSADVWRHISPECSTHEPRAMGGIMRRSQRNGWTTGTDRYLPSGSIINHNRPQRVWKSLIFMANGCL